LEHIEDDTAQLCEWSQFLKIGGKIVVSVPAHMRKFGYSDEWAGHVRRYEKKELRSLFESNGFAIERLSCHGFPLISIIRPISNILIAKPKHKNSIGKTQLEKTKDSGNDKNREYRYQFLAPQYLVYPFTLLQKLFYYTDLGFGYVLVARKLEETKR